MKFLVPFSCLNVTHDQLLIFILEYEAERELSSYFHISNLVITP